MTHAEKLRKIRSFYSRLTYNVNRPHAHGKTTMAAEMPFGEMLDSIDSEERRHRRMGTHFGQTYRRGLPVSRAVELLAVQILLQYRTGKRKEPRASQTSSLNRSIFLAWEVWVSWKKEIRKEFSRQESIEFLDTMNYAKLVSGPGGES